MPTRRAEDLALEMLMCLGIQDIAHKRLENCSKKERFLAMFIRAIMMKEGSIILKTPQEVLGNSYDIREVITEMQKIDTDKKIYIVDLLRNKNDYEGCACSTEKYS